MSTPTCPTCRFHIEGACHRYPPVVTESVSSEQSSLDWSLTSVASRAQSSWPTVGIRDWCGEHQPAPEGKA